MKLEQSERLFVESLFEDSIKNKKISSSAIDTIERLTGDASTRRYYRVKLQTSSYVVCIANPTDQERVEKISPFLSVGNTLREHGVRVPVIYDYDLTKGYYLEEDLGDNTMLSEVAKSRSVREELALYERCVDQLVKIHLIDTQKYSDREFTKLSFDSEKLMGEVEFTLKYFVEKYLEHTFISKNLSIVKKEFKSICDKIAVQKMVLTHRDFHSRNMMHLNGEFVVIDFQDARMGIPQYDLVSLLDDCYYQISNGSVEKLKILYWEKFAKKNSGQSSYAEFSELYDLMAIQRVFKAIGSFSYIYSLRGDKRYLKYIGFGFEKLRSILLKYPEYKQLRHILSLVYYGN